MTNKNDKKDNKPITKEFLTSRLNAVKSGRTSPSFVASELFSRLGNKVKDIEFKKRGGLVGQKKKKKVVKRKK